MRTSHGSGESSSSGIAGFCCGVSRISGTRQRALVREEPPERLDPDHPFSDELVPIEVGPQRPGAVVEMEERRREPAARWNPSSARPSAAADSEMSCPAAYRWQVSSP